MYGNGLRMWYAIKHRYSLVENNRNDSMYVSECGSYRCMNRIGKAQNKSYGGRVSR